MLSILLTSCASTMQYTKLANVDSFENNDDVARIIVFRPSVKASAVKFGIYQDDRLIGKLGPKSYLSWLVEANDEEIIILSKSEKKDILTIKPQKGKTYYIKQTMKMGILTARAGIDFVDEDEAKKYLKKLNSPKSRYAE